MILKPEMNSAEQLPDNDFDADFEGDLTADPLAPIELELSKSDCGERLDKVVARMVPQFSRGRLQSWIEEGHITVDGKARQHFETDTFLKFRFLIDQTYLKELYERLLAADPD